MNAIQFLRNAASEGLSWDTSALLVVAEQRGLRFSADQLMTAADELWGNLSEEELGAVQGGGGGCGGGGNGGGNGGGGGGWGNSCFFIRPGG